MQNPPMTPFFATIISILLAATQASAATPFSVKPFTDVPESHINFEAIEYLRQNNVIRGYQDGTFKPESRINRAEFLQLITNPFLLNTSRLNECVREEILGKDLETVFYKDVAPDDWFAAAVCLASVQKIVNGYPDGTFRPAREVSFVEAAKMIVNVFAFSTVEEPGEAWFTPYVEQLSKKSAIPTTINAFGESITRGEMAEMIYRLKANVTTKQTRAAEGLRP